MRWFNVFRNQGSPAAPAPALGARDSSVATPRPLSDTPPYKHPAYRSGSGVDIQYLDMASDSGAVTAAPIGEVIERVEPLIQRLYHEIGWAKEDFEPLIRPMIVRYAKYVHLLPASESHHHARLGGLLVHGLEVAIEAARLTRETVFDLDRESLRDTESRAKRHRIWPAAAACGALMHDLGKALVDLIVERADNGKEWKRFRSSLSDWIVNEGVKQYTVEWRPGPRLRRHEPFGPLLTDRIIGNDLLCLMDDHGDDIFEEMLLGALEEVEGANGLGRIIKDADSTSVRRDRDAQSKRWREGSAGGHPIVNRTLEAFQGLLADGTWQPNSVGGCIWVTREGVFLNWGNAVAHARGWLRENQSTGTIPSDAGVIADLLLDAKIAKHRSMADGSHSRSWMVKPPTPAGFTGLGQTLGFVQMVLIPNANLLFKGRPIPAPVELEIAPDKTGVEVVTVVAEDEEPDAVSATTAVTVETATNDTVPPPVETAPARVLAASPQATLSLPVEPAPAMPATAASTHAMPAASTPEVSPAESVASVTMAEATAFFQSCGILGQWLLRLLSDCAKDPASSRIVCYKEKKLLVRWPDAVTGYSESPTDIVKFLGGRADLLATKYKGAIIDPVRGSLVIKALVNATEPPWPAIVFSEELSRHAFVLSDPRPAVDRSIRAGFSVWVKEQSTRKDVRVVPAGQLARAYARAKEEGLNAVVAALLREPSLIAGVGGHDADQRVDMTAIDAVLALEKAAP